MLTNLFESRNKTFLNLVKLGDFLGRSLRENVELFSIQNDSVIYLTESGHVIKGNFDKTNLNLKNIVVQDASTFSDKQTYSKLVDKKVSSFLADILENDLHKVEESFESILNAWESRLHFNRITKKLNEKCEKFNDNLKITTTPEFSRLQEIKKELVNFLKESNNIINIPEIRNAIKLSSVISKSFNIPKVTIKTLSESKKFEIPKTINHTLYDHLCKQELIAKELVEAKNNLDNIWITNEKIQSLPSYIYESDENIMKLIAEIISEIPYFAMASKKQLTSLVEGNLDLLTESNIVSNKDLNSFITKIFEFKKPVKNYILKVLNEKYGVNIQNLTDPPTFNSLGKTQILIFEALSKLSPKNSVMKKVLREFSELLRTKTGVEMIDVNNFLTEIFAEANYSKSINETQLMNYLNFDKVADDLGKIGAVLKMIQAGMGVGPAAGGGGMPQQGMQSIPNPLQPKGGDIAQDMPPEGEGEGQFEPDGGDLAGMGSDMEGANIPAMDSEDAANEVSAEGGEEGEAPMPGEEGEAPMPGEEGDENGIDDDVELVDKDQLVDNLKELEMLISTLKDEIGVSSEGGDGEDMGEFSDEESENGEDAESFGDEESEESPSDEEGGDEIEFMDDDSGEEEESDDEEPEEESEDPKDKKKSKPNFPPKK